MVCAVGDPQVVLPPHAVFMAVCSAVIPDGQDDGGHTRDSAAPHWLGTPPAPQATSKPQLPQYSVAPQLSGMLPQFLFWATHVVGVHTHLLPWQVSGGLQVGHVSVPVQPSEMEPHCAPRSPQVLGVQPLELAAAVELAAEGELAVALELTIDVALEADVVLEPAPPPMLDEIDEIDVVPAPPRPPPLEVAPGPPVVLPVSMVKLGAREHAPAATASAAPQSTPFIDASEDATSRIRAGAPRGGQRFDERRRGRYLVSS
jgi:hypothetical protein